MRIISGFAGTAFLVVAVVCGSSRQEMTAQPDAMDVGEVLSRPEAFQDKTVCLQGIVTSVCNEEGCFIDLVSLDGTGPGVLVNGRNGKFKFPRDCVGKTAVVSGTFYCKVYPFARMAHWKHHGWRPGEGPPPRFAVIYRLEADDYSLSDTKKAIEIRETPLVSWNEGAIDLDRMEFEAARTGMGKKELPPGGSMPNHSTGRYHELLYVVEGCVTVIEGDGKRFQVSGGKAFYIPPQTEHAVKNLTDESACYLFFYSLPERPEEREE